MRAGSMCPAARCAALLAGLAGLTLATLVGDATHHQKRAEISPVPFAMGTRYGRSPDPRHISPRNERFYMGTRYGKRSEEVVSELRDEATLLDAGGEPVRGLVCEYTGVSTLYRCLKRLKRNQFNRLKSEELINAKEE